MTDQVDSFQRLTSTLAIPREEEKRRWMVSHYFSPIRSSSSRKGGHGMMARILFLLIGFRSGATSNAFYFLIGLHSTIYIYIFHTHENMHVNK